MYNHGTASAYTSLLDNSIFEAHCSKERGPCMESPITILLFELHFKHGRWCSAPSFRQKIYRIRLLILLLFCVVYGQARCNDFLFHLIDNWVSTIKIYEKPSATIENLKFLKRKKIFKMWTFVRYSLQILHSRYRDDNQNNGFKYFHPLSTNGVRGLWLRLAFILILLGRSAYARLIRVAR